MRRRDLIALFGGAPVMCLTAGVRAQPAKTFHLGILVNTRSDAGLDEFLQGLRDHGYVEGQNLVVELRFSEGAGERWPLLAKELAALKVDAIVVQTTPAALAAKQATRTIPIVITTAIDPVGAGLADSLARPGGNVTGVALLQPEISGKALSLLKEAVPTLSRVAVLWNEANPAEREGAQWSPLPMRQTNSSVTRRSSASGTPSVLATICAVTSGGNGRPATCSARVSTSTGARRSSAMRD